MSLRNGLVVLCVLILFSATSLFSQATSGGVFGTVTDPTGAVVAGAKVTITDVSKGITVTTTTNESGNYAQTHLTVGTYKITVEATGFKTSVDRKSTRLNSSHSQISYAVFCLKKKKQ